MCMILGISFLFFSLVLYSKKTNYVAFFPHLFFSSINLLLILLAPGNSVRYDQEVVRWFPEYANLSFFQKIDLGYSSTLNNLFLSNNQLIILLSVLLLILIVLKKKNILQIIFAAVPAGVTLLFGPIYSLFDGQLSVITRINQSYTKTGTSFHFLEPLTWLPNLFLTILLCLVIYSIITVMDTKAKSFLPLSLFFLGLLSRMILAFSPTVWASGIRVYIFLNYAIILIITYIIVNGAKGLEKTFGLNSFLLITISLGVFYFTEFIKVI